MKAKFILSFFIAVISFNHLFAQATITSNGLGGGNWSDGSVLGPWFPSGVPAPGDIVIITAGDVVNADAAATPVTCTAMEIYGTLIIDAGVTLTITGCNGENIFGQNFTIDGAAPGTLTNNGTFVLDQGACGGAPSYENAAGGTFTNNNILTLDNGADFLGNGTFVNTLTINVNSTSGNSFFENFVSINNTGGTVNVNNGSTFFNAGSFGGGKRHH